MDFVASEACVAESLSLLTGVIKAYINNCSYSGFNLFNYNSFWHVIVTWSQHLAILGKNTNVHEISKLIRLIKNKALMKTSVHSKHNLISLKLFQSVSVSIHYGAEIKHWLFSSAELKGLITSFFFLLLSKRQKNFLPARKLHYLDEMLWSKSDTWIGFDLIGSSCISPSPSFVVLGLECA